MKVVAKLLLLAFSLLFASFSTAQTNLSLYISSLGSAAITQSDGKVSLLVLAGGNDQGEATAGSCVIGANLTKVEGGFNGTLSPISTGINSYNDEQAQGKKISIDQRVGSIVISDVDYIGICSLDASLINIYKEVQRDDKGYKSVYAEMINLAHEDSLFLYKKGMRSEAMAELAPYASYYQSNWLADKKFADAVIPALNDYAYFLQENNQAADSIPILNDIVGAAPKRAVAWLNLADSNWAVGKQEEAKVQYKMYGDLMAKSNQKSKVPKRAVERVN
ncbi:hypothetical protein BLL42_14505 [Pseudomonas frederiksbergensis]|uniref:Tetratricopeptide repeat-containing protein n=1 Tax=Pseudomonas frederiksbergensis TaxID=104087 RepID=A0A1J0EM34_9PSED|nr:hypothetical protein [Pseudomonas frederiksbergensis]APC16884.1 hypothetical protein BLL42_14505 [Pseudomonas frederiksbergensis]